MESRKLPPHIKTELTLFQSYTNLAITMGAICVQFLEDLWPTKKNWGVMISSSSPKAEPHQGGSLCHQMLIKK